MAAWLGWLLYNSGMMHVLDQFRLDGKVALVTGGNRGLGLAMATGLAEAGADIVNLSRGDGAAELQDAVGHLGRRFQHIQFDLLAISAESAAHIISRVVDDFGRIDILLNNAGLVHREPSRDYREQFWDETIQVNLNAVFKLSQAAAGQMQQQGGGKIIQTGSVLSFQGGFTVPAYAATKHAVVGLTKALANEWAQHHINVNAIAPGYFRTDMTTALQQHPERSQAILDRIPARDWGNPDDLKGLAVFLASDASRYMHGSTITIDGGWLAR